MYQRPSIKQLQPPAETQGGGDISREQRKAEKDELIFKTPIRPARVTQRHANLTRHASLTRVGSVTDVRVTTGHVSQVDTPRPHRSTRRAISLEDRKPRRQEDVVVRLSQRKRPPLPKLSATAAGQQASQEKERRHAKRLCQVLVLNAWRKRKERNELYKHKTDAAVEKLNGLRRQKETLRTLLDAEKTRVAAATEEIRKIDEMIAETREDCDNMAAKCSEFQSQTVSLEARISKLSEASHNLKNSQIDAQNRMRALDAILEKEVGKLSALIKQMRELRIKLGKQGQSVEDKKRVIHKLESEIRVLSKTATLKTKELQSAQLDAANKDEEARSALAAHADLGDEVERLLGQEQRLDALSLRLQQQVRQRDDEQKKIEDDLNDKMKEIDVLLARVAEKATPGDGAATWGVRARRLVSSVVQFPLTILSYLRHSHGVDDADDVIASQLL